MTCTDCGREMEASARFCPGCGRAAVPFVVAPTQFVRPREGRMIAGVCAGVAARFGWDVAIVRLVLCLSVLVCAGTGLLAYVVAWVVMPNAPLSYMPPSAPDVPMGAQPAA